MSISNIALGLICCGLPYAAFIGIFAVMGTLLRRRLSEPTIWRLSEQSPLGAEQFDRRMRDYIKVGIGFLSILVLGVGFWAWWLLRSPNTLRLGQTGELSIFALFLLVGVVSALMFLFVFWILFREYLRPKKH